MRSLAGEAKAARQAAVLDEAAIEFNRSGLAAANLAAIASRVGLSRAAIYNYCADREDLALQAYLRACELTGRDLERANAEQASGAARIQAFLRLTLELDHPPLAVLTDLHALSPEGQDQVRTARARNVATLSAMLQGGVADGSLRTCDPELACQAIWGVLSWAPLARTWTGEEDETSAIRMAAAIPALLLDGIAADAAPIASPPPIKLAEQVPLYDDIDRHSGDLLAAGSALFNQRGVEGVSLDDVAAAVGATKGLVYHRFKNKPAFVAGCYERAFDLYDAIMARADTGKTGVECGRLGLELNIQAQLGSRAPLSLTAGFGLLPKGIREGFAIRTRKLRALAADHGRRGVKDGSLRPYDLEPVSLASAGVFSYLAKWPSKAGLDPVDVSRQVANIFLYGLRPRTAR